MLDPTAQQYVVQGFTFMVGLLVGYGIARVIKGLLLVAVGLVILVLLGLTLAGLPPVQTVLGAISPIVDLARNLLGPLLAYPLFLIGLLIGFVFGIAK